MVRYLIRRILWAMVLFLVVTIVTFVIFFLIPNDLAAKVAGQGSSQAQRERAIKGLGLDQPVYKQYGRFLWRLTEPVPVHVGGVPVFVRPKGNLGRSYIKATPVNEIVAGAAAVTASLVFGGVIMWMMIALPIGIFSALRPRSLLDRVSMVFVLVGISAHPVWIGLIFAFRSATSCTGSRSGLLRRHRSATDCGGPVQWAYHMILPWITYAILFAALYVRMIRANVMETMNEDYVRTARAKGAPNRASCARTSCAMRFCPWSRCSDGHRPRARRRDLHGDDLRLTRSRADRDPGDRSNDLPIVMGVVVFATLAIIIFNLIIDVLYAFIDPRIRLT